ncbi:flagellar motor protein MotB [Methylophaga sp.]|uniref:flagellar motor protein MotB n=1 Tax=Methylophaga sp. TaxID=2024840 RepID=UPI003F6A037C
MNSRPKKPVTIIPRYIATFADLMTLLLCFFVLMVAMAEMDALKFKMVVRSMEDAFGVQRPEPDTEIIKGTSIIKQSFSTASPKPTPLSKIRQASDSDKKALKIDDAEMYQAAQMQTLMDDLESKFSAAINEDLLSLEQMPDRILIRINEKTSFTSGGAELKAGFLPVLNLIANTLADLKAEFIVSGHTDDVPLSPGYYRSNWELSGARATSVVHALLRHPELTPIQFRIEAYADTQPLESNKTSQGRAMNRRVEIGIVNRQ